MAYCGATVTLMPSVVSLQMIWQDRRELPVAPDKGSTGSRAELRLTTLVPVC